MRASRDLLGRLLLVLLLALLPTILVHIAIAGVNAIDLVSLVSGAMLGFGIMAFGAAGLIGRPARQLLAAAGRWQAGDLSARTGMRRDDSEFGQLGRAFDEMAAALQTREAALRAEQAKSAEILESINDSFYALDANLRFTYVNDHALRLYGLTRERTLGRSLVEVFPATEGSALLDHYRRVLAGRTTREFETISPTLRRWMFVKAFPQPDGGLAVHFRDISARKQAEAALQASEARLQLTMRAARIGIWEWEPLAGTTRLDRRAAEILGGVLPADRWVMTGRPEGEAWRDAVHPEDRQRRDAALAGLAEARAESSEVEYRLRRPDGSWAWVAQHGVVVEREPATAKPCCVAGILRDVSEQRTADAERQQLLHTLDLASFMTRDFDGTIRFWSKGCESLYGWTAEEVLGRNAHELLRTAFPMPRADIEAALRRDGAWSGDLVQWRRDGQEITVAARKALRSDAEGRPVAVVETLADVTALREAQAQLRRLNRELEVRVREAVQAREAAQAQLAQAQKMQALGQLAGGIAHDFNNILQTVAGAAALIERRAEDERIRQFARTTLDAAERGASITGRLLSFSRHSKLRLEPLVVAPVLESLRDVLAHTLGSAIDVRTAVPPSLPRLVADRGPLETALVNLGANARDAMPDGGSLTLAAEAVVVHEAGHHPAGLAPGGYVCISVSDSGSGMDEATLAHATEPFFTTKPRGQGTGLGLATVRGFVEQSGGGLAISSRPGHGTTVRLWLPQAAAERAAEPVAEPAAIDATGRAAPRVLLVDDDELVRETLALHLEDSGCQVRKAASGSEALTLLDEGVAVDVLVTDLSMPGINGIVTIREAHQRRPGLPAVLLTGYAGDRAALEAEDGLFLLLRKPVRGSQLVRQIEAAVGGWRAA